jgi:alanine racemase
MPFRFSGAEVETAGRPTRAVVDLSAIARNYRLLEERAGAGVEVIPVVKADAYGHGAVPVARRLEQEGAGTFAVAIAEEGVELRRGGVAGEILLLNFSDPADVALHRAYRLTPTLHDLAQAEAFARAAEAATAPLPFHVKLDTGMGRLGIQPRDIGAFVEILRRAPALSVRGVFAQLSAAEDPGSPATPREVQGFSEGVAALRAAGLEPGLVHLANSAGVLGHPESRFSAVRPGLALYGVPPSERFAEEALAPAMTLETRIMAVREFPPGTPLGYGGTFVTRRPSTIAVLPIGYHDGLRRSFSGRVSVLLRGREAPIIGAVSMDLTLVDVTDCGASEGERIVCLGEDSGRRLTAWDLARAAGTIPYEILCGIGPRVQRTWLP